MKFDHKKFFDGFKDDFDETLDQAQVDGIEFLPGQMLPSRSGLDMSYGTTGNVVFIGNDVVSAGIVNNCESLRFSKFGVRGFSVSVSVVIYHILRVIGPSAFPKMIGITARRVVAFIMTNSFIGYVFFGNNLIHQSVSQPEFALKEKATIAMAQSAFPKPAIISFFNKRHQAFQSIAVFSSLLITSVCTVFGGLMFVEKYLITA